MTPDLFKQHWKKSFPGCPPVGYYLREAFSDIWFRIHTLPLSKRYADDPQERAEILHRHNTVLSSLFAENEEYALVTTGYSASAEPVLSYPQLKELLPETRYIFSIPKNEYEKDPEPYYWHFFMTGMRWQTHSVDELLTLVADEEIGNILFVSFDKSEAYYPYDGGGDIFVKDDAKRNMLKNKYSEWLPKNAMGL